jgi:hypothetical protein
LLLVILFLIQGCTINRLFLSDEVDKVNVVKYSPYVKHYRAYFARSNLKPVIKQQKYLFLYNRKKKDLAVLLHRNNRYLLYSFTRPTYPVMKLTPTHHIADRKILRSFANAGYHTVTNPSRLGFDIKTGLRRYKGIKTLMIALKDYRKLKKIYKDAIKHYRAEKVLHIKTRLPAKLIRPYLIYYAKRAKSDAQRAQLQLIAKKLHITLPYPPSRSTHEKSSPKPATHTQTKSVSFPVPKPVNTDATGMLPQDQAPDPEKKPFNYYLHQASLYELSNYLDDPKSPQVLGYGRYRLLKRRLEKLKEEELLQEGSLETLIATYKQNKNPRFKARILELLKEKQEEGSTP